MSTSFSEFRTARRSFGEPATPQRFHKEVPGASRREDRQKAELDRPFKSSDQKHFVSDRNPSKFLNFEFVYGN